MNRRKIERRERRLRIQKEIQEAIAAQILNKEIKKEVKKEIEFKKQQELKPWLISDKTKFDLKIYAKGKYKRENNPSEKFKIHAYTSLSPSHHNINNQRIALESWHKSAVEIYSLNHPDEIDALKKKYPQYINFISTTKTTNHLFGKHYILINEMLDHFKEKKTGDIIMLINSDIILNSASEIIKKVKNIFQNIIVNILMIIFHHIIFKSKIISHFHPVFCIVLHGMFFMKSECFFYS